MRQMSKRRLKRDANYQRARYDVYERAGGRCELAIDDSCTRRCEQVHHRAGRQIPDPHRLELLIGCCHVCHARVHANPERAYQHGWMLRRNGKDVL